ncbi:MAG: DNA repair protein RadC [Burkholderiales bacterium]|nr:DNA repair protein RadC [Burkholderiales bacterium]
MSNPIRDLPTAQLLSMITRGHVCEEDLQRPLLEVLKKPTRDNYPTTLLAVGELAERALADQMRERTVMNSPQLVRDYLRVYFAGYEHESFVLMHLDAQHRLIEVEELFRGTLTQTSVYPREVIKSVLKRNSSSLIVAHNHPSGVCNPSQADRSLTRMLKTALECIDVQILDHIIVGDSSCRSMAEIGDL